MAESRFLYISYIRAPAQRVFDALTDPAQNKQFWSGYHQESSWRVGADFAIVGPEGNAWDTGKVLEFDPPRRFAVTWNHQHDAAMKAEGEFDLQLRCRGAERHPDQATVTHTMPVAELKLIGAVSTGWPMIMSSLKSLLETGKPLG